jgi:excisionase family DNA binding protein
MLLTTGQAAKRMGISGQRVRKLISEGRIKVTKAGAFNLIAEEDCHYEKKRTYPGKAKGGTP